MSHQNEPARLYVTGRYHLEDCVHFCTTCELLAVDVETIPHIKYSKKAKADKEVDLPHLMTIVSYSGIDSNGYMRSFAIPLTKQKSPYSEPVDMVLEMVEGIREINASPVRKTLHNGVYDSAWFIRYQAPLVNYAYDSMTMWWSKHPDLPKTLDFVSSILLDDYQYWKMGRKETDMLAHAAYAMSDTESTLRNTIRLLHWMRDDPKMRRNFMQAHMRCLAGLGMSLRGLLIDNDMREQIRLELEEESERKLEDFRNLIGDPDFNPKSPKQMNKLIYGILGASPRNAKGRVLKRITKNTKVSTGRMALRGVAREHPILKRIVDAYNASREPAKQVSSLMGIEIPKQNRLYTSYDGVGTTTSRLSSRSDAFGFGTNLQNIRKTYRRFARADTDSFLFEIDLSASDDVFVSYESQEEVKIELLESGADVHSYNAANVFFTNWTYEEVVEGKKNKDPRVNHPITGIRPITKKVTHGANYLMAGLTLLYSAGHAAIIAAAKNLGHDKAETWTDEQLASFCEKMDAAYRNRYKRLSRDGTDNMYHEVQMELIETGGFMTCFNYFQRFNANPRSQDTLRAAAATVGQANTAGRINIAMDELEHGVRMVKFRDGPAPDPGPALQLDQDRHGITMRLQTHDSLGFNVNTKAPWWEEGVERIFAVMSRPIPCKGRMVQVGTEADVQIHWGHDAVTVNSVEDIKKWLNTEEEFNPTS